MTYESTLDTGCAGKPMRVDRKLSLRSEGKPAHQEVSSPLRRSSDEIHLLGEDRLVVAGDHRAGCSRSRLEFHLAIATTGFTYIYPTGSRDYLIPHAVYRPSFTCHTLTATMKTLRLLTIRGDHGECF